MIRARASARSGRPFRAKNRCPLFLKGRGSTHRGLVTTSGRGRIVSGPCLSPSFPRRRKSSEPRPSAKRTICARAAKRSTPGPHGHRVTLTAAPSPSPSSPGKNRDRVETWNPIEKSHAAPGDWPPGHNRQCSALSDRRWTSPTPDGGALSGGWGLGQGRDLPSLKPGILAKRSGHRSSASRMRSSAFCFCHEPSNGTTGTSNSLE